MALTNGKYLLKHKMLNVQYHLIVNESTYKLMSINDEFIKYTTLDKVNEFCDVIKQLRVSKLWDIAYYINGKLYETIKCNAPYPIATKKAQFLQRTTHKQGKVIAIPAN